MKCSSPCDAGVRYRDVACDGSLADATIKHYHVDDASCSADEMVVGTVQLHVVRTVMQIGCCFSLFSHI